MILFRPVGPKELALIEASGWRAIPPRLPEQPIFCPVLTFTYAEKIARDWNSTRADADYAGFVTRFEIDDDYAAAFKVERAGARDHLELWVPAGELDEFNRHIRGEIEVVATYRKGQPVEARQSEFAAIATCPCTF